MSSVNHGGENGLGSLASRASQCVVRASPAPTISAAGRRASPARPRRAAGATIVFVGHGLRCGPPVDRATDAVSTQNPPATLMDRIAILADLGAGRPATQGSERPRTEIALREGPPERACRSADID